MEKIFRRDQSLSRKGGNDVGVKSIGSIQDDGLDSMTYHPPRHIGRNLLNPLPSEEDLSRRKRFHLQQRFIEPKADMTFGVRRSVFGVFD
jgi:hypothetical protein